MNDTAKETLRKLADENGLTKDHFFKAPQGFVIIKRQGIERIQAHRAIQVRYEVVKMSDDLKFVVIKAVGRMATDGATIEMETYGESSPSNTKQSYPVAMAEKRALSRVVLKLTGFYEANVYGEDESEDFRRP